MFGSNQKIPDLTGVRNTCNGYDSRSHQWEIVRDCVEGSDRIKEKAELYLPMANYKKNEEGRRRYEAYKQRAVYVNFIGQSLEIMHGMIFRRTPTIKAPDEFKNSGLLSNVDRKGSSIYQFSSDSTYDVMQTGFGGYLVDMPSAPVGISVQEAEEAGIKPYIKYYKAEDVRFWKFTEVKGVEKLTLVILREYQDVSENEFSHDIHECFRVLALDENGNYYQRFYTPLYDRDKKVYNYTVKNIDVYVQGEHIQYLPFTLLPYGEPEKPMLYDLAVLNIAHYQSTADYKNGVHMTTIPTGYITGHQPKDYGSENKNDHDDDVTLGGDVMLTEEDPNAKFGVLTFAGEGLSHAESDIDKIEAQMAGIFIKDIAPDKKTSETAESAYVHRAGENAKLATFARNMSIKLTQAVQWFMEWNGYEGVVELQLNYDYETMSLDPNIINSIANISGQGKFPLYCVFWILKQQELIEPDMNYDDFIFLIDEEQSSGMTAAEIYEAFKAKRASENRMITNVR